MSAGQEAAMIAISQDLKQRSEWLRERVATCAALVGRLQHHVDHCDCNPVCETCNADTAAIELANSFYAK
jgi:hypothetical protein